MPFEQGPYLKAAFFCERVLEERDGVLSFVRIVDRIIHVAQGPHAPVDMPPFTLPIFLVVALISGRAKGSHEIRVDMENPLGERKILFQAPVYLEGEERGHNTVVQLNMTLQHAGLYWFYVLFDNDTMTKIPLRIIYQRMLVGAERGVA